MNFTGTAYLVAILFLLSLTCVVKAVEKLAKRKDKKK